MVYTYLQLQYKKQFCTVTCIKNACTYWKMSINTSIPTCFTHNYKTVRISITIMKVKITIQFEPEPFNRSCSRFEQVYLSAFYAGCDHSRTQIQEAIHGNGCIQVTIKPFLMRHQQKESYNHLKSRCWKHLGVTVLLIHLQN